jgi:hypothetical protein
MRPAKPAGKNGLCEIFWALISPESGLPPRFAGDGLFKNLGIQIPRNPARFNSTNYSLPVGRDRDFQQHVYDGEPVGDKSMAAPGWCFSTRLRAQSG